MSFQNTNTRELRGALPENMSAYRVGIITDPDIYPLAFDAEAAWTLWHRGVYAGLVTVHHNTVLPEHHQVAQFCWQFFPTAGYGSHIAPERRTPFLNELAGMLIRAENDFLVLNTILSGK